MSDALAASILEPGAVPRPLVIGVGEVLWDLLPDGRQLGGAPANFAYHAQALGADSLVISRVGDDALGREILERLAGLGMRTDGITTDPDAPTGTVGVALDVGGKPTFTIYQDVAWDFIAPSARVLRETQHAAAVCFGTLAQRHPVSRGAIQAVLAAAPPSALRVFDINLRQHYWSRELILEALALSDVLKINDEELAEMANMLDWSDHPIRLLRRLAETFGLKAVALTKGAAGSELLIGDELWYQPGSRLAIVDTVGAGDSYTAALTLGMLAGDPPDVILESAHRLAEYVCTQPGAMPRIPPFVRGNAAGPDARIIP
ncbi:MAG: carbohydrate kinase [Verrucomicrobiota bacterium]